MIRSELVQKLCRDFPDLTQREVESVVGAIFDSITDQLSKGGRVELRGFGAFSTRKRDARIGRNPRTGESVEVDAKRVPYFKPGKEMRERSEPPGSDRRVAPTLRPAAATSTSLSGRGGTVDAGDLKSSSPTGVWVRFPPSAPASQRTAMPVIAGHGTPSAICSLNGSAAPRP